MIDDGYKSQGTSIHDSNSFKSTSTTNLVSSSSIQTPTDSEKGLLPWFAGGRRGRGQGSYAEEFSPNSGAPSLKSRASEYVLEGDFLRSVSKLRTGSPELEASVVKIPEIESDWQVLNKNEKLAPTTSKKLTKQRPRRHTVSSVEVPSRIPTPESISIPMISKISSSSGMNGKKLKKSGGISQGYKSIAPQSREVWFAERGMEL